MKDFGDAKHERILDFRFAIVDWIFLMQPESPEVSSNQRPRRQRKNAGLPWDRDSITKPEWISLEPEPEAD